MLCYVRFDVYDGIDVNRASKSKECAVCHFWYFLDKRFRFQPDVCNGCHDVLMMSSDKSTLAILLF